MSKNKNGWLNEIRHLKTLLGSMAESQNVKSIVGEEKTSKNRSP